MGRRQRPHRLVSAPTETAVTKRSGSPRRWMVVLALVGAVVAVGVWLGLRSSPVAGDPGGKIWPL